MRCHVRLRGLDPRIVSENFGGVATFRYISATCSATAALRRPAVSVSNKVNGDGFLCACGE